MTEPDPARLAATDRQLAALGDRLDRNARAIMCGDVPLVLLAVAGIVYTLVTRQPVSYRLYAAAWGVIALGAAGGFVQGLMLRSYRAEIRELRSSRGKP